ncbi:MAG: hypothetical protein K8I03_03945 [Ignavibacteria bacterium]|nr:hypothetical protein [Ignavibacteria bacterium]
MNNFETLTIFKASHMVLNRNLAGITHEESLIVPAGGGNPLNRVVGQIAISRDDIREMFGLPRVCDESMNKLYARGTLQLKSDEAIALDKIVEIFNNGQKELEEAVTNTNLSGKEDGLKTLSFLAFHEAYHTGQTGLLRRITGKEGAIK